MKRYFIEITISHGEEIVYHLCSSAKDSREEALEWWNKIDAEALADDYNCSVQLIIEQPNGSYELEDIV